MAGSSGELNQGLLSELECPVCLEYMTPPIVLCVNGHNICSTCRRRQYICPTCREPFSNIRSVTLERIANLLYFPCSNQSSGCPDVFTADMLAEHRAVCIYGPIQCPLSKTPLVRCNWTGKLSEIEGHVTEEHPLFVLYQSDFESYSLQRVAKIIITMDQLFLYYKYTEYGFVNEGRSRYNNRPALTKIVKWHCVVQHVGSRADASKFKTDYVLHAENGIEEIKETHIVRSIAEDLHDVFRRGKCLRIDDDVLRNFVTDDRINLTVRISKVEP